MNAAAFIAAARSMVGTPYRHQGRLPGVGLDCIGLPFAAAWEVGLVDRSVDVRDYPSRPDGHSLIAHCDLLLDLKKRGRPLQADLELGDLLVMRWDKDPQHFGIVADYPKGGFSLIHAMAVLAGKRGRVVEHNLDATHLDRSLALYRIRGMQP